MKYCKALLISILVLVFSATVGAEKQDKRTSVVVYNLDAQGVPPSTAEIMTTSFVAELSSSEKLFVRDEKTTLAVIKERGLAQSGHCSEKDVCRIDNAKLIKADWIILGSVGKLEEKTYIITIRVADVNGTTKYPLKQVCRDCSIEQLLGVAEELARNVKIFLETGKKPKEEAPIQVGDQGSATISPNSGTTRIPATAAGTLEVRTNPPGAKIIIDAAEMGTSNTTLTVTAGKHEVLLVKEGYADVTMTVDVPSGKKVVFTKNLTVQNGDVEVTVNVAGASIYLDGKLVGTSVTGRGVKIKNVRVGEHKIKVVHPGYEATEVTVSVAYNQANPVSINLAGKPGKLYVSSTPQGATVKADGVEMGKTPVSIQLDPGNHVIEVSLNGYEASSQNVQIEAGGSKSISMPLKKAAHVVQPEPETQPQPDEEPDSGYPSPPGMPAPPTTPRPRPTPGPPSPPSVPHTTQPTSASAAASVPPCKIPMTGRHTVAILPFEGFGVEKSSVTIIENALYGEMMASGKLQVPHPAETQKVLKQIGLGQTGDNDASAKVDTGKILKAQKIVTGSIEKLEQNYYTVSIRVIDVQTAATEYQVSKDCRCSSMVQLRDFVTGFSRSTIIAYLNGCSR